MKCKVKNIILIGTAIGVLIFLVSFLSGLGFFFHYISGLFLADLYINSGRGEAGILPGLLIGLLASVVTSIFYSYIFCKLFGGEKKASEKIH